MHQGSSLLISPFGGPLPAPCGCGSHLACDQTCVRHSQATVPRQLDQELVSGGHRRRRCSGRRGGGRARRYRRGSRRRYRRGSRQRNKCVLRSVGRTISSFRLGCPSRRHQWFARLVPGNITGKNDHPRRGVQHLVAVAAVVMTKV